jgi:hypothetical protein
MRFGTPLSALASDQDPAPSMSQYVDMLRLGEIEIAGRQGFMGPASSTHELCVESS